MNLLKAALEAVLLTAGITTAHAQSLSQTVPDSVMQRVYETVRTPYKFGMAEVPADTLKKVDCPSVFRKGNKWFMTYLVFDGRGYETWLAESKDLLRWKTKGRLMSFSDTANWDNNQKAGYLALEDYTWGGSYAWQAFDGKYWMSYFGGPKRGYETPPLSIGIAYTSKDPSKVQEWNRLPRPVLTTKDADTGWWDDKILYKSSVIWDKSKLTDHPFVMYYNANGDSLHYKKGAERIGMAVSDDMQHWQRFGRDPVMQHGGGITGDPYIQQIGNVYVMFYFGAFYKGLHGTENRFACSYDLVNWTDWKGEALITPSEPFDAVFAHKSYVIKWNGVVYHFYCAVNKKNQRGIAVATSADEGKSVVDFPFKIHK